MKAYLVKHALVFPINPKIRGRDRLTRVALEMLAKSFYGLDINAGLSARQVSRRMVSLNKLQSMGALDKEMKITDEGIRLLTVGTQPRVFGHAT